jgi:predicted metal-binding membrane protein
MAGMPAMPGMGGARTASATPTLLGADGAGAIGMWTLMVVAMMLPTALPAIRHVAANTLRWRRPRAMSAFALIYSLVWVAFGVLVRALSPLWASLSPREASAGALALAAGWQLTAPKRRAVRDCHRSAALPPTGPRATSGLVRFAWINSSACVRSCWAMMLAMGLATSAIVFWMLAIAGVVVTEKLAQRPRRATQAGAALLGTGTVLAALAVVLA